ncbi:hypothetical protein CNEO2_260022 [Clostridium neonatale]|nr:hypothetical protein CNEO2_260022 [Clostridium neonatale]CAI3237471.1 hypothetical protein CNEO2_250012 [Clostridium neonatale]CAI3559423.1 hypothetical protein CNEO4_290022 [Clostridium neonatale]
MASKKYSLSYLVNNRIINHNSIEYSIISTCTFKKQSEQLNLENNINI